jgi:hypothetical protein
MEMHFVLDDDDDSAVVVWIGSSSGDDGRSFGRRAGKNVDTNHDRMLAKAARMISTVSFRLLLLDDDAFAILLI